MDFRSFITLVHSDEIFNTMTEQPEDTTNAEVEMFKLKGVVNCVPATDSQSHSLGHNKREELVYNCARGTNMPSRINDAKNITANNSIHTQAIPGSSLNSSLGQSSEGNLSVQPSSFNVPNSEGNLSVQPSSIYGPLVESSDQQQISQNQLHPQNSASHQQPQAGGSHMQQSSDIKKEENFMSSHEGPPFVNEGISSQKVLKMQPPGERYKSIQQSDNVPEDNNQGKKKVFILHSIPGDDPLVDALLLFATTLREKSINVSIDLFEQDSDKNNWFMWYEREILSSKVVLCIITPDFYETITKNDRIKGYAVYNLIGDSTRDIAFRAVFLDTPKNMEYVPLSMRGATCYCISSNDLNIPENDEFTNLYAFLTGQNRFEKPKLGKMIVLTPRKSRCKLWSLLFI